MGVPVKIRVLRGFEGYEAGQVFEDWPSGMCEGLIAMGAIEEVKDAPQAEPKEPRQPPVVVKKRG